MRSRVVILRIVDLPFQQQVGLNKIVAKHCRNLMEASKKMDGGECCAKAFVMCRDTPDVKADCARQSQGFAADCTSKTEERGMTLHGVVGIFLRMKNREGFAGWE